MSRAVSIHIGVNRPEARPSRRERPLKYSETIAWRMACLAENAGYDSIHVLRGAAATQQAVEGALLRASEALGAGDILLVTFSGHGSREDDKDCDDRCGRDHAWCLAEGLVLDDWLVECWQRFQPGVRIVVVSDSCYGGGMNRDGDEAAAHAARPAWNGPPPPRVGAPAAPVYRDGGRAPVYRDGSAPRYRSGGGTSVAAAPAAGPCVAPARDTYGIRASVLLLASAGEDQQAREGLFSRHLLDLWDEGTFRGTYCDLYRSLQDRVMTFRRSQEPQLLMLGEPDPAFPLETAFHLERREPFVSAGTEIVYRGDGETG